MKLYFFSKLPKSCYVAFSGGVDSSVLTYNLIKRKCDVTLLFVHHNTEWCDTELEFVKKTAQKYNISYIVKSIPLFDKTTSLESFWSKHRNAIFQEMDKPVLVGHNLDDNIEWYTMSTFTGISKIIQYSNGNIYRPMIVIDRKTIINYAIYYNIEFLTDPTNSDTSFSLRNKVRNKLIPNLRECFPGINKVVKKLTIKKHILSIQEGNTC